MRKYKSIFKEEDGYEKFIKVFLDQIKKYYINKAYTEVFIKPVKKNIYGQPNKEKEKTFHVSGIKNGKKKKIDVYTFMTSADWNELIDLYRAIVSKTYINFDVKKSDPLTLDHTGTLPAFRDWIQKHHKHLPQ